MREPSLFSTPSPRHVPLILPPYQDDDNDATDDLYPLESPPPTQPSSSSITNQMKITVIACALLMMVINLPATLIYSFLPHEATQHGSSETVVGFVYSSYSFAVFIAAYFGGKISANISAERMILYGGLVNAVSTAVFAFALSFDGYAFIAFCMCMRFFQGIGASFVEVGTNVLVTYNFQDNPAMALSWVDLCNGLACVFGPFLGGVMYDYGGFRLPFLVTGIASGILIVGLVFILPENDVQEDESEEPVHMTDVLKIPSVTILLFVVISCLLTTGFLDATLETHLASYNLSPSIVGAVISLLGLSYSIVAPLVAWLLGRYGAMFCFVFGGACTLIGLLLLAPMPYLSIPPSLFFQVVGVLLVGSGTSFLGTPILPCVLKETKHLGEVAREIVVGTAICAYSIGDILGPVVGTALLDHFSFQIASLVVAGIIGSFTLLQIFTMLYKNQSYRNEVVEEGEEETSFRQPLLIEEDSSILQKPIQS